MVETNRTLNLETDLVGSERITSHKMDLLVKYLKFTLSIPKHQRTTSHEDVAPLFREPFIQTGYRLPHKPLKYYLCSLLQLHNESINIWSHFAAMWVFLYNILFYNESVDFVNDQKSWPFIVFAIGTLGYSILSTIAHMFQSKSEYIHYLCFQLDYIGIGLNSLGSATCLYFYVGNKQFYDTIGGYYLSISVVLSVLICVFLSYAKLKYPRPYPPARKSIVMGIMVFSCIFGYTPVYFLIYDTVFVKQSWDLFWDEVYPHLYYTVYFFLSGVFFATHIPERFVPGKFDICGQGHQIFHIIMAFCSYLQYKTFYLEYNRRPDYLTHLSNPRFSNTLLLPIIVAISDLIIIFVISGSFRFKRSKEERAKFIKANKLH